MKDAGEIIDLIDKSIIKDMRFVSFNFDNTPSGKMHLGITFVLSKQYSDQLSVNVIRGIDHSIEDGAYINKAKHGYFKDGMQYLRPDGRNHTLIKDAFRLRLEGEGLAKIASYLNSQHYERSEIDGSHKLFKWSKQTVQKILRNPVYAGVVAYGDGHIADLTEIYNFEPVVTVDNFIKINNLKGGHKELVKLAYSYRKGDDIKANLIRGRVFCYECEEPKSSGITNKKDKKGTKINYFYYRCETDDCKLYNSSTRAKVIINFVNTFLAKKPFSSKSAYNHYVKEMTKVKLERSNNNQQLLRSLQGKEKELKVRHQRLKDFVVEEKDERFAAGFKGDILKAEADQKQIQVEIKKLQELIDKEKEAIVLMPEFLELMDKIAEIIASTDNMAELDFYLKKMFSNFFVDKKNVVSATLCEPFSRLIDSKVIMGAQGGTRTRTPIRAEDFKSSMSTIPSPGRVLTKYSYTITDF